MEARARVRAFPRFVGFRAAFEVRVDGGRGDS